MHKLVLALLLLLSLPMSTEAQATIELGDYINSLGVARGPILATDGSAAAPSYAFASGTGTGLYHNSGTIAVSTSGNTRAYWTSSQFVLAPASLSGGAAASAFSLTQTWNTTGAPVLVDWTITDTASDAASLAFRIRGGAAGTTELFKVGRTGILTIGGGLNANGSLVLPQTNAVAWVSRSQIKSSADGLFEALNASATGFTTLNLGPTTGNTASGSTSFTHVNATIDMATATGTGTGTITVANFFPAGCTLDTFSGRVTTILAGAGLTTWSAGTGGATTVLGTGLAIAANTLVNGSTFTANPTTTFYGGAAKDLVLTAAAGVFSTGVVKVTATCIYSTAIGS